MRIVKVFKYEQQEKEGRKYMEKVFDTQAVFHQFGVNYEEFENGPGMYSTAIVELGNGSVKNIPVEMITFLD